MKIIKRFIRGILEKNISLIIKATSKRGKEYSELMLKTVCREYEKYNQNFVQYRLFPKNADDAYIIDMMSNIPKMAIVIQGPLDRDDKFTLETVRLYKKYYPDAYIIVSTWSGEDAEYLREIEGSGAFVVTTPLPQKGGRGNINYQATSTLQGIEKAKELGAEYILKNRSDVRLYRRYLLQYLYMLCKKYPVGAFDSSGEARYCPQERIIVDGFMFDTNWLQDFFYFGRTDELLTFFSVPFDESEEYKQYNINKNLRATKTRKEFLDAFGPSQYFMSRYCDAIGAKSDCIEEYWKLVKEYFVCVGWEELELYWHKYDARYSMNLRYCMDIDGDVPEYPLTYKWRFSNWFLLHNEQIAYDENYERYELENWRL